MAEIKKIQEGSDIIYPISVPQAIIDPITDNSIRNEIDSLSNRLTAKKCTTNIEQTLVSSEDGGTNTVTCYYDDNTSSIFQIKNGAKGNSGYTGAAGELEVVNDITSGGETSALSAEQGLILNKAKADNNTVSIDISKLGLLKGCYITSNGEYSTTSANIRDFRCSSKLPLSSNVVSIILNNSPAYARFVFWDGAGNYIGQKIAKQKAMFIRDGAVTFAVNICINNPDDPNDPGTPLHPDYELTYTEEQVSQMKIYGTNVVNYVNDQLLPINDDSLFYTLEEVGLKSGFYAATYGTYSKSPYFLCTEKIKWSSNFININLDNLPVEVRLLYWNAAGEFINSVKTDALSMGVPSGTAYLAINVCLDNTNFPAYDTTYTTSEAKRIKISGMNVIEYITEKLENIDDKFEQLGDSSVYYTLGELGLQKGFYNSGNGSFNNTTAYAKAFVCTQKLEWNQNTVDLSLNDESVEIRILFWDESNNYLGSKISSTVITDVIEGTKYMGINVCLDNTFFPMFHTIYTLDEAKQIKLSGISTIDYINEKFKSIDSILNQDVVAPCLYNPPIDICKEGLKILDLGNSFTVDSQHYLSDIIQAVANPTGYSLYRYFRPSGSFRSLYRCYNDEDTQTYNIAKVSGDTISGISTGDGAAHDGSKLRTLLSATKWDLIIIHQWSKYSDSYDSWNGKGEGGYLKQLIYLLKTLQPQAKLGYLLTHSYASTYSQNKYDSALEMWENIAKSVKRLINNYGIDFVIPYGTAVQNLRSSSICDEYEFSTDGLHMADGLGDYVASCCYYQSVFAPRFGSVLGNSFRKTDFDISTHGVYQINDENALLAQKAAAWATYDMFELVNPDDL